MQMVGGNGGNQFRQYAGQNAGNQNGFNVVQNVRNQVVQNAVQNLGVQNVGNQNRLIVVSGIANQNLNGNGNVVIARAEGNVTGNNDNQIRCYKCRGLSHFARNCTQASTSDNTAKTRRPQPRSKTKSDRVPSVSKSSCSKNKEVEVEEHPRILSLSKNKKHMSSECNKVKLVIRNDKSEVVYAICKQCLITANHDVYVLNYVNNINSHGKKPKANVLNAKNQKKQKPKVMKPKKVGSNERLALTLGCSKHMTENLKLLINFVWKFLGIVCFGNEHVAAILEFKNQILKEYFDSVGISHQASSVRTPQKNRVVEQRNQTLVEAARTMLIFSRAPLSLWVEVIATAKLDISFLHVFGALCYPKNDREDIGKLGEKGDIGFFIGYSADSCAYRVYNRRIKKIMWTINVTFYELLDMDFEQCNSKLGLQGMTSGQISSRLDLTYAPSTATTKQPTEGELYLLFEAMYDDYIGGQPSTASRTAPSAQVPPVRQTPTTSTTIADTALSPTNSSSQVTNIPSTSQDVDGLETQQQHAQQRENQAPLQPETVADNVLNAMFNDITFVNPFATPSTSAAKSSSSQYVDPSNMHTFYQPFPHEYQ
nr:hypothetical protein [Tanacetum cinerariifolium]